MFVPTIHLECDEHSVTAIAPVVATYYFDCEAVAEGFACDLEGFLTKTQTATTYTVYFAEEGTIMENTTNTPHIIEEGTTMENTTNKDWTAVMEDLFEEAAEKITAFDKTTAKWVVSGDESSIYDRVLGALDGIFIRSTDPVIEEQVEELKEKIEATINEALDETTEEANPTLFAKIKAAVVFLIKKAFAVVLGVVKFTVKSLAISGIFVGVAVLVVGSETISAIKAIISALITEAKTVIA